ncbi:hypothetical protein LY78DRAFT_392281 [Colletotrichum sublineola]|nr:hypothetical protein LY78DRAFT_392281 [Colletotrichum sublineola]
MFMRIYAGYGPGLLLFLLLLNYGLGKPLFFIIIFYSSAPLPTPLSLSLVSQGPGHPSVSFCRRTTTDVCLLFISRIASSSPILNLLTVSYGLLISTSCRHPRNLTWRSKRPAVLPYSHLFLQAC